MSELWTSELHPKFNDRYLKLNTIQFSFPGPELVTMLNKLQQDYVESRERLTEAFEKKKKQMYGFVAGGIIFPLLILSQYHRAFTGLGTFLLYLALLVGVPLFVFKFYLPRYWKLEEFFHSFLGAEARIKLAVDLLEKYRSRFSDQPVQLSLNLRGLELDPRDYSEKMGVSHNLVDFTGNWCHLIITLNDGIKAEISCVKNVQVEQIMQPGKEEHQFTLKRNFNLHEQVSLEYELDKEKYQGLLQFRDRDWKSGEEYKLNLGEVSAGSHSLGVQGWITPIQKEKAKNLSRMLGKSNQTNLSSEDLLQLMEFVESHFLKQAAS